MTSPRARSPRLGPDRACPESSRDGLSGDYETRSGESSIAGALPRRAILPASATGARTRGSSPGAIGVSCVFLFVHPRVGFLCESHRASQGSASRWVGGDGGRAAGAAHFAPELLGADAGDLAKAEYGLGLGSALGRV